MVIVGVFIISQFSKMRVPWTARRSNQSILKEISPDTDWKDIFMRVARGRASFFSSHGRGIGPQDAVKKDSQGLSQNAAGNPGLDRKSVV